MKCILLFGKNVYLYLCVFFKEDKQYTEVNNTQKCDYKMLAGKKYEWQVEFRKM